MFATEKVQPSEELSSLNKKYIEIMEEKNVANSLIIGRETQIATYNCICKGCMCLQISVLQKSEINLFSLEIQKYTVKGLKAVLILWNSSR